MKEVIMVGKTESGFFDELKDKLKKVGWTVLIVVIQWLLEKMLKKNPGDDRGGD